MNGTRGPLGPNFGSNALQSTIGAANYNALELSARHTSGRLEFFASYTYSKSLDQSSNIGEEVNPFNPALSYALSSFDVKHNLVLSYEYQLPFDRIFRANRLTRGWSLSGITRFASGFPVTMVNNGDNSLIGTNPNGVNNSSIDEPDYNGGPLHLNHNPRTNGQQLLRHHSLQHERTGHARQCKEALLLRAGRGQLRHGASEKRLLLESRSRCCFASRRSTSSTTRNSTDRPPSTAISAARHSAMSSAPRHRAFCRLR